jgi:Zn finger protein HypA/HybF involved in hydrogenase expression
VESFWIAFPEWGFYTKQGIKMSKTKKLLEAAIEIIENEEYQGICLACGQIADEIEPDARKYECECCGAEEVYGAEEVILMFGY